MAYDLLRTATPMGDWRSFEYTVGSGDSKTKGYIYLIADTYCVSFDDYVAGDTAVFIYNAEKILVPKKTGTGEAFVVGDYVYLDTSATPWDVTPNFATAYICIGICVAAAAETDETVEIDLKGDSMPEK